MFIKRKKNRSGTVSIVVAEKISGYYKELTTIGIARTQEEVDSLIMKGRKMRNRNAAIHGWIFSVRNERNVRQSF